ncbi:hypothetical protein KQH42_10400 [Streptomyces sp. CHA1]|uniref:hypothetical protein n=1 Tax=Streptomyces TaxID=1883 RepID=UPI00053D405C|nr:MULTISPECIES: hypothetical protein [unclassified Streptomyces]UYM25018.1 hypothetical protein NQP46_22540 [Streptomyces albus]WDV31529.1 hypothetical protein OIM90_09770 [Streptomyces sp. AD16]WSB22404.1 hypothetical protein OHB02_20460 [Streptomyces albidoflavus]MBP3077583.1 hypothetical protein [Streptomyces sp. 604F]MBT3157999.1 hypothetical protein [Streptomyces sp. G11C]
MTGVEHVEYLADACGGSGARSVFLGGIITPTRRLALRWLRRQAHRFADALDPDPRTTRLPARVLLPASSGAEHAPSQLRFWAADLTYAEEAADRLATGYPYCFTAREGPAWYRLTARPLFTAARPSHFARSSL